MNNYLFIDAVSYLDADLLAEHLEKKEKLRKGAKNRRKIVLTKWSAVAACFTLVLVCASVALTRFFPLNMGDIGEYKISLSDVEYMGQIIDSNEFQVYLKEHENEILKFVAQKENVNMNTLVLSDKGIYHVTLSDKQNYINYNIITFYVMDEEGAICASVDLFRENNTFRFQVNSSGVRLDKLNEVLSNNPNTDFALVYIGDFTEAVIAPDNTIYFLNGEKTIQENVDYYSMFNKEINAISSTLLE